jgi:hypothetical protein
MAVTFDTDWSTATGNSLNAITDGGQWGSVQDTDHLTVVNNPPSGCPTTNALRYHWTGYDGIDCSYGENYFVEKVSAAIFTNPHYIRVYFNSGDPSAYRQSFACYGRKFFLCRNNNGFNGQRLALYEIDAEKANGDYTMQIEIKNRNFDNYDFNHRTAERLTATADWPGQQSKDARILPNTWYCIEFGVYYHATNGWIKAWLNGNLVINATAAAFDGFGDAGSGYNTSMPVGEEMDGIQIPSFRNGGTNSDHYEYLAAFVIADEYIGPLGEGSTSVSPSGSPSLSPSQSPSKSPSISPSVSPSRSPSMSASQSSSLSPSASPSSSPSTSPSAGAEYPKFILSESPYIVVSGESTTVQLTAPTNKDTNFFVSGRIQDDENPTDIINLQSVLSDSELATNGNMELDSDWMDVNVPETNERSTTQVHGDTYSRHIVDSTASYGGTRNTTFTSTTARQYRVSGYYYLLQAWGTELVTNGGMESSDPPTGWSQLNSPDTFERSGVQKHSGDYSLHIIKLTGVQAGATQNLSFTIGRTYRVSLWYYLATDSMLCAINQGDGTLDYNWFSEQETWVHFSKDITSTGSDGIIYLVTGGDDEFYVDDVSVREINNPIMRVVFTRGVDGMGQNIAWLSNYDEWTYFQADYTETNGGNNASAAFINNSETELIEFYLDDISVKEVLNKYCEIEWCIQATDEAVVGDTYEFRVTKGIG